MMHEVLVPRVWDELSFGSASKLHPWTPCFLDAEQTPVFSCVALSYGTIQGTLGSVEQLESLFITGQTGTQGPRDPGHQGTLSLPSARRPAHPPSNNGQKRVEGSGMRAVASIAGSLHERNDYFSTCTSLFWLPYYLAQENMN